MTAASEPARSRGRLQSGSVDGRHPLWTVCHLRRLSVLRQSLGSRSRIRPNK